MSLQRQRKWGKINHLATMRKIILYSAMSLDGYIARANGDIDWLTSDDDFGYEDFFASVDTTIMGYKTYHQVLGFGEWHYSEKENFVFTRDPNRPPDPNVTFVYGDHVRFVREMKAQTGRQHIWLIGGGQVNLLLGEAGLVDELRLFVMPVSLGRGISLFEGELSANWKLTLAQPYPSGVVEMRYTFAKLAPPES